MAVSKSVNVDHSGRIQTGFSELFHIIRLVVVKTVSDFQCVIPWDPIGSREVESNEDKSKAFIFLPLGKRHKVTYDVISRHTSFLSKNVQF